MTDPQRRDWPMVIADLRQAGLSYYKIALAIGVSGHHVKRWGNGVEPGHFHGEKLLALHGEMVGHDAVPSGTACTSNAQRAV